MSRFSSRLPGMLLVRHGRLDKRRRRRLGTSLELLLQIRHLPAQHGVVGDELLVLLLEQGQLAAAILTFLQLPAQEFILLPQTLVLFPEKVVALENSAIHGAGHSTQSRGLAPAPKGYRGGKQLPASVRAIRTLAASCQWHTPQT